MKNVNLQKRCFKAFISARSRRGASSTQKHSRKFLSFVFSLTFLFVAGTKSAIAQYTTVAAGAYNDTATWGGPVPPAGADVTISHYVTLSSQETAGSVTIGMNGTLDVTDAASLTAANAFNILGTFNNNGGTINVGTSGGGNKVLALSSGAFTLTNGTVNVNGSVVMSAGNFNMAGGNFNIDPNSGSAATSVADGKDVFTVSSSVTGTVNGGKITFVDPPFSGTGRTFAYTGTLRSTSWAGSTMLFGGTAGTNATGAKNGFNVDTRANGSAYVELGNIIANGGSTSNRYISGATTGRNGFDVSGNLTINPGSEVRTLSGGSALRIAGNITNNGTFFDMAGIYFNKRYGPVTTPQYVTTNNGKGKFRNSITKPTANFTNLSFNNTSAPVAITFNFGDGVVVDGAIFVSGKVSFTNGIVDIGTDNQFIFTVTAKASRVNGALLRGYGPGGGAQMVKQFPAGASSFTYHIADNVGTYDYSPVTANFSANSYAGRAVSVNVFDKTHSKMSIGGSATDYITRYWRIVGTPIGTSTAKISFKYLPEDVIGSESKMQLNKWDGLAWVKRSSTVADNTITINTDQTTLEGGTLAEVTARCATASLAKSDVSAASQNMIESKVSVFPNPVKGGKLNVKLTSAKAENFSMALYNNAGQQVYTRSANSAGSSSVETVDLPRNLPSGIYTFILSGKQGVVSQQKIVVDNS